MFDLLIDIWNVFWFLCGIWGFIWFCYFIYLLFTYKGKSNNNKGEKESKYKELESFNSVYKKIYGKEPPI